MSTDDGNGHLSRINTLWSLVSRAHHAGDEVTAAQEQLLERYSGAIRRYLLGVLRDRDAAEDVFQEFACCFLRGELRHADPQRGRFRNYVKGVLFHLIADYHKKRQRQPRPLGPEQPEQAVSCTPGAEQERAFLANWRDELLVRTWADLEAADRSSGQHFHAVLRFRADHPALRSQEMAEQLSAILGRPLTAAGVRKTLERARDRFADLLLEEVAQALSQPTLDELEEELIDLHLLEYCRPALERRRQG